MDVRETECGDSNGYDIQRRLAAIRRIRDKCPTADDDDELEDAEEEEEEDEEDDEEGEEEEDDETAKDTSDYKLS